MYGMDLFSRHWGQLGDFFSNPNHIALRIYTDGVPLFKSSSIALRPVYLVFLNLPPKVRVNSQNIILAELWSGPRKPPMKLLIEPIVKVLDSLSTVGMSVVTATGLQKVRARLVMGIYDLPAKATALCIKQFNGEFGCTVCHHPGKRVSNNAQIYLPKLHSLRQHSEWVLDAETADQTNSASHGIVGMSASMSSLDMVVLIPIDYMHAVLEGVVKMLTNLWFNSTNHREPYYISHHTSQVDNKLVKQCPPLEFSRPPRSIKNHLHYWKASELRSWLLFYSFPILVSILPLYWHHHSLLVTSMHILLQEELSSTEIQIAEKLLWNFYKLMPELYGESSCTMNTHLLSHLCMYIGDHFGIIQHLASKARMEYSGTCFTAKILSHISSCLM